MKIFSVSLSLFERNVFLSTPFITHNMVQCIIRRSSPKSPCGMRRRKESPIRYHSTKIFLSFFTFSFDSSYYAFVDNNNKTTTKGNADDRFILYLAKYYSPARPERWTWVNLSWYLIRSSKPNCGECIILFSRRTDQHNIINGLPPDLKMNLILQQPQPMV